MHQARYHRRILNDIETHAYDLEPGHFMEVWVTRRGKVSWAGHWDSFTPARVQAYEAGERDNARAAYVLERDDDGALKLWCVGRLVRIPNNVRWQTLKTPELVYVLAVIKVVPGIRGRPSVLADVAG